MCSYQCWTGARFYGAREAPNWTQANNSSTSSIDRLVKIRSSSKVLQMSAQSCQEKTKTTSTTVKTKPSFFVVSPGGKPLKYAAWRHQLSSCWQRMSTGLVQTSCLETCHVLHPCNTYTIHIPVTSNRYIRATRQSQYRIGPRGELFEINALNKSVHKSVDKLTAWSYLCKLNEWYKDYFMNVAFTTS